jgi:hypothetical protein
MKAGGRKGTIDWPSGTSITTGKLQNALYLLAGYPVPYPG